MLSGSADTEDADLVCGSLTRVARGSFPGDQHVQAQPVQSVAPGVVRTTLRECHPLVEPFRYEDQILHRTSA
jgi:hypothetical protein